MNPKVVDHKIMKLAGASDAAHRVTYAYEDTTFILCYGGFRNHASLYVQKEQGMVFMRTVSSRNDAHNAMRAWWLGHRVP